MADTYFKPLRCSAEIPLSPFDGVVCGALADVIVQEGPRCDSCLAEFGGTKLDDGPETPKRLNCQLCGHDPVCCPCVVAGLTARAEATINHEKWREQKGGAQ